MKWLSPVVCCGTVGYPLVTSTYRNLEISTAPKRKSLVHRRLVKTLVYVPKLFKSIGGGVKSVPGQDLTGPGRQIF